MNRITHRHFLAFITSVTLLLISVPGYATNTQIWNQNNESNLATIDHQPWQNILDNYLQSDNPSGVNRFRYNQVSVDDKNKLKTYLDQLQATDPRAYRRSEQMAYWINLYNALTIDLILENYPVKSIKKIGKGLFSFGPWDDDIAHIAGNKLTLNDIEHKILRPLWKDPRIHYAVNCASYGCPNLAAMAFTTDNIDSLLNQSARDYVNHPRGVRFENGNLIVSSIYHWYSEDFGGNNQKLIEHLQQYAEPKLGQRLNQYQGTIDHQYDWSLNEAR